MTDREQLINDVRKVGQTLIDKAEEIVGGWDEICSYSIRVELSPKIMPTLYWTKETRISRFMEVEE